MMKTVLISSYYCGDTLFDKASNPDKEDLLIPLYELKKQLYSHGFDLQTVGTNNPATAELIIFSEVLPQPGSANYPFFRYCLEQGLQSKMHLHLIESPMVMPHAWNREAHKAFAKVYTWNDDFVDDKHYFKTAYFQPLLRSTVKIPYAKRKLCTTIASNKMHYQQLELYSERIAAIRAFERLCPYQFDLYGTGWNQPRHTEQIQQIYPFLAEKFPSYRGPVASKLDTLANYKFSICYENMIGVPGYSGYITEKIFHCLMAGCVPIYLGANNITDYIPAEVFIDRRKFNSYDDLYAYLLQISEDEYQQYILNIEAYLGSELFYKNFSIDSFVKSMLHDLGQGDGMS